MNTNTTSLETVRICDKDAITLAFMESQMHRIKHEEKNLAVVSST
jgi:hypothetical protein